MIHQPVPRAKNLPSSIFLAMQVEVGPPKCDQGNRRVYRAVRHNLPIVVLRLKDSRASPPALIIEVRRTSVAEHLVDMVTNGSNNPLYRIKDVTDLRRG